MACPGVAEQVEVGHGMARQSGSGLSCPGVASPGEVGHGMARQSRRGYVRRGEA